MSRTVWVLGDQLNTRLGALAQAEPGRDRVLIVESLTKLASKRWHVQQAHLVVASMPRFAEELRGAGFDVDYRRADSLRAGHDAHVAQYAPDAVVAMEPASWDGRRLLASLGVDLVRSNQFLCHDEDFAAWANGRATVRMETF